MAGWNIKAGGYIDVQNRIFAGVSLYSTSKNCMKAIMCKELKGEIAYGKLIIISDNN
jgi:hypothetical protein